ncbi:MAG: hypothetical protein RHS_3002 [Robinsoniella sp. RHS]|nr:MAG: hypothetical protein RHS_3002 [Robinsoniella sp. RHS]
MQACLHTVNCCDVLQHNACAACGWYNFAFYVSPFCFAFAI